MSYSFEEIMAYHPDNSDVYKEIKHFFPKIIPFVGAGLTQFAYYTWPDLLKKLSGKLSDIENREKVNALVDDKKYLDAAQLLKKWRGIPNLSANLATILSASRLNEKREELLSGPISLLPYLFQELVLTTNFDQTLETVYKENGHPFNTVAHPGDSESVRKLIRQSIPCGLFKLHGTVTRESVDFEKLIFTRDQYNKHYGKDSPLTRDLKTCFETHMMLFLGCSLENDRTMKLLQEVIQPGDTYYAIINCQKSERDKKVRQLGKKHIRPILYEENRHEAVRVILEHLLEETNPSAYVALPVHVGALKSIDLTERFSYKAEVVQFVGREQELDELRSFLSDESQAFRWWAIVGSGGCGKSRLAYHFQKHLPSDWNTYYLGPGDYQNLSLLTEQFTHKTLLIADYVQENAKELGKWMEQLNERKRSLPIRVLLVERGDGNNPESYSWLKQMYSEVFYEHKLRSACYQKEFLTLAPMQDSELLCIIEMYASVLRQNGTHTADMLSAAKGHMLLQKLKAVDPELCRPLYAMFLTDAYMGGQNPEQWSRIDILDYVTTREQKRLDFSIRQIFGKRDEKLYFVCSYLYSVATVLQDISVEKLQTLCPEIWDVIREKADAFVSPVDMLKQIGLVIDGKIRALRPDLIGEYYIYCWLFQHPKEIPHFLYIVWKEPSFTAAFFDRLVWDYGHLINESPERWELLLPKDIPCSEIGAYCYTSLIIDTTYFCDTAEECRRQVSLSKELSIKYANNLEIKINFTRALVR